MSFHVNSGESEGFPFVSMKERMKNFTIKLANLFKADETSLFCYLMPVSTSLLKGKQYIVDGKSSKDCLMMLLSANSNGINQCMATLARYQVLFKMWRFDLLPLISLRCMKIDHDTIPADSYVK
ncbi:hypothetical protein AVEN_185904-1 [Araneus ventricosus]|uniref:Uncharacterized protein n=1 Tax=Araneus ventricosus TaxID=182803 RepID=A0A4Y2ASL0_ARAVE|nr:hypothetical protein AVEN_185904-1 [Araneus ventricosus]